MLLAIEVGNTDVVLNGYSSGWGRGVRIKTDDAYDKLLIEREIREILTDRPAADSIVYSSVVPELNSIIPAIVENQLGIKPYVIGPHSYATLEFEVLNSEQIGTDLVANATAAYDKFQNDLVVVDFGTALTFTALRKGRIDGVSIAPGIETAMRSLHSDTSQLPKIPFDLPDSVLGTNTVEAIQSGIMHGYSFMVKGMLEQIRKESGKLKVVGTGGIIELLEPIHNQFDLIDRNLTIAGLRLIYLANNQL